MNDPIGPKIRFWVYVVCVVLNVIGMGMAKHNDNWQMVGWHLFFAVFSLVMVAIMTLRGRKST